MEGKKIYIVRNMFSNHDEYEDAEELYAAASLETALAKYREWKAAAETELGEYAPRIEIDESKGKAGLPCWNGIACDESIQYDVFIETLIVNP